MAKHQIDWRQIVQRDPYLAGSLAARGYEWFDKTTAEQETESVGLLGEARAKFVQGWQEELAEQAQERDSKRVLFEEYEEMAKGYTKGDPAAR